MRVCVCVCVLTGLFSINNDLVLCYMSLTDLHVIIYGIFFHFGHCKLAGCTRMYRYMIKLTITTWESVFFSLHFEKKNEYGEIYQQKKL